MTAENTSPKSASTVAVKSGEGRSVTDRASSGQSAHPVSSESEAIIKEVSVRRRTAMKVLADR